MFGGEVDGESVDSLGLSEDSKCLMLIPEISVCFNSFSWVSSILSSSPVSSCQDNIGVNSTVSVIGDGTKIDLSLIMVVR